MAMKASTATDTSARHRTWVVVIPAVVILAVLGALFGTHAVSADARDLPPGTYEYTKSQLTGEHATLHYVSRDVWLKKVPDNPEVPAGWEAMIEGVRYHSLKPPDPSDFGDNQDLPRVISIDREFGPMAPERVMFDARFLGHLRDGTLPDDLAEHFDISQAQVTSAGALPVPRRVSSSGELLKVISHNPEVQVDPEEFVDAQLQSSASQLVDVHELPEFDPSIELDLRVHNRVQADPEG